MSQTRTICVTTKYRTLGELIERLYPLCDDTSVFVATRTLIAVGERRRFVMRYADHSHAMIGFCTVRDAWATDDNPFGRPGVRLTLELDNIESQCVFEAVNAHRRELAQRVGLRQPISLSPQLAIATSAVPRRAPTTMPMPRMPQRRSPTTIQARPRAIPRALTDKPTSRFVCKPAVARRATAPQPIRGRRAGTASGEHLALPLPPPPTPDCIPLFGLAVPRTDTARRPLAPALIHDVPRGERLPTDVEPPVIEIAVRGSDCELELIALPRVLASSPLPVFSDAPICSDADAAVPFEDGAPTVPTPLQRPPIRWSVVVLTAALVVVLALVALALR